MSGLLNKSNLANTDPALGDLRIQTSMQGLVVPVGFGRNRVTGNLLWYGDFKAIKNEEESESGKGGGAPARVYYTYTASVIMSLGAGVMTGVRSVWIDKQKFIGTSLSYKEVQVKEDWTIAAPYVYPVTNTPFWSDDGVTALTGATETFDGGGGA